MKKIILLLAIISIIAFPPQIKAQGAYQQVITTVKARVTEIVSTGTESSGDLNGTATSPTLDIKATIDEGEDAGKIVEVANDYVMLK